jgi:hypothetical protein
MILELLTLSLNLTRFTKDRGIGDQKHLNMHRKVKVLIARWLSSRMETRTRRLRRALRDHQRAELRRIRAGDRRARGLRLYVAWSCKEKEPMNFRTVVPLQPSSGVGEPVSRNAA